MRAAALVAANDLRRRLRDRSAVVTAFVAPFALATIIGLAFGGGGTSSRAFVRVALAGEEASLASEQLLAATLRWLQLPPGIAVAVTSPADARARFGAGAVDAAVVVRRGFVDGRTVGPTPPVDVRVRRDQPLAGALASSVVAALSRAASTPPALRSTLWSASPPIALVDEGQPTPRSLLGYFGPAMAMVFVFLGMGAGARSLVGEKDNGTLARLRLAPVAFGSIIAGKVAGVLVLSILSMLVIWATTTWVLGATWGSAAGVVLLTLAVVAAFGGIVFLITVLARTDAQADGVTAILGFALALLGGNFFPPGALPPLFERLSRLTPNGWALQGFGSLSIDGRPAGAVVAPAAVLLAIGLCFGAAAAIRLRRLVLR